MPTKEINNKRWRYSMDLVLFKKMWSNYLEILIVQSTKSLNVCQKRPKIYNQKNSKLSKKFFPNQRKIKLTDSKDLIKAGWTK